MPETTVLSPEPITIEGQVEGFVPQLEQLLEQGQAHEHALREAANEQRRENGRIQRLLHVLEPQEKKKPPKRKSSGTVNGVSPKRLDLLMAYFHQHKDREITQSELRHHFGWRSGDMSRALKILREQDRIRLVGNRTSKAGGPTKGYMLMEGTNDG